MRVSITRVVSCLALAVCITVPGCGTNLSRAVHMQTGVEYGENFGDDSFDFSNVRAVVELGYVTGETSPEPPTWGFGGTGYLAISEDFRPGVKVIARRFVNSDMSVDFAAGPMITYDSSGLFNGFIGGVSFNMKWVTLRSELMTWPTDPWDEYHYTGTGYDIVHHDAGHEQVWYNGLAFNGTAGWFAAVVGTLGFFLLAAAAAD